MFNANNIKKVIFKINVKRSSTRNTGVSNVNLLVEFRHNNLKEKSKSGVFFDRSIMSKNGFVRIPKMLVNTVRFFEMHSVGTLYEVFVTSQFFFKRVR